MKIRPVGVELSHEETQTERQADGRTDGQRDMAKIIVAFCNYANAIKNSTFRLHNTFMCFVWLSQHTAIISLYRVNLVVDIKGGT
jgi:hypothetical protein